MSFNFGGQGGGSNTPNKPLFGATNTSGGSTTSLFGSTTNTNNNNATTDSSTPGAKPFFGGGFGGGAGVSSNLFGSGASATASSSKPNLVGGNQATAGAPQPASGFSFGQKPAASGTDGSNTPKPSLFGTGTASGATSSAPNFSFANQTAGMSSSTTALLAVLSAVKHTNIQFISLYPCCE